MTFSSERYLKNILKLTCLSGLTIFCQNSLADSNLAFIANQFNEYKTEFPEIEFLLLDNIHKFEAIFPFKESLGPEVSNVDYEHPDSVRLTLVEVQEYRIETHLNLGNGSATLFRTPDASITDKKFTCITTLPNTLLDQGPLAASRFLYGFSEPDLSKIPEAYVLDNRKFFAFSIDHELFHCVDAYVNGPLFPRTLNPIKASHDRYKEEQRAEIFAALRHLSRNPSDVSFLKSLAIARTVNLLSVDLEHYTTTILGEIIGNADQALEKGLSDTAYYSMHYAERVAPDYEEYLAYLAAVAQVLDEFEVDYDLTSSYPAISEASIDPDIARNLSLAIRNALGLIRANN